MLKLSSELIKYNVFARFICSRQHGAAFPRRNRAIRWGGIREKKKTYQGLSEFVPQPSTSHNSVLAHPPLHPIFSWRVTTSPGLMTPHPLSFPSHSDWESQQQLTSSLQSVFYTDLSERFFLAAHIIHNHANSGHVHDENHSHAVL